MATNQDGPITGAAARGLWLGLTVIFAGLGLLVSLYGVYEAFQQPHASMNTDLILVGLGITLVLIARIFHAQSMSSHTAW
jgi:hypothetical protein